MTCQECSDTGRIKLTTADGRTVLAKCIAAIHDPLYQPKTPSKPRIVSPDEQANEEAHEMYKEHQRELNPEKWNR